MVAERENRMKEKKTRDSIKMIHNAQNLQPRRSPITPTVEEPKIPSVDDMIRGFQTTNFYGTFYPGEGGSSSSQATPTQEEVAAAQAQLAASARAAAARATPAASPFVPPHSYGPDFHGFGTSFAGMTSFSGLAPQSHSQSEYASRLGYGSFLGGSLPGTGLGDSSASYSGAACTLPSTSSVGEDWAHRLSADIFNPNPPTGMSPRSTRITTSFSEITMPSSLYLNPPLHWINEGYDQGWNPSMGGDGGGRTSDLP